MKRWEIEEANGPFLPFDFVEKEEEDYKIALEKCRYDEPKNDNERLLDYQYRFLAEGDMEALGKFFELSKQIALKFIAQEAKANGHVKKLSWASRTEKAADAASYIVEMLLGRKNFLIKKNAPGYLYLRVQKELYYRNASDSLVEFCDDAKLAAYIKSGHLVCDFS